MAYLFLLNQLTACKKSILSLCPFVLDQLVLTYRLRINSVVQQVVVIHVQLHKSESMNSSE